MVRGFRGQHRFLSNFHPSPVEMDGLVYPTVEHAYQAAKTDNRFAREMLLEMAKTPSESKRMGRTLNLRDGWDSIKVDVMLGLLRKKFSLGGELWAMLDGTGDQDLVELNDWGDMFWGVVINQDGDDVGSNHLGRLLMQVREENRGRPWG